MEPDLPPCLQECCQEVRQAEEEGVKKARVAQRGRQCCWQVQQERLQITATKATKATKNGDKTRTATRRLVLRRELLKDTIYMATKAVDKYSRRGYKEVRERRQDENGDKKARAAQRAAQGRHLHGYQGCQQVQQERLQRSSRTVTRRERQQEGSCCAESCSRMPRELATVKKKDS